MSIQHTYPPMADRVIARAVADFLRAPETGDPIRLTTPDGSFITIPPAIAAALAQTAEAFAHGNGVLIREQPNWKNVDEAARILGLTTVEVDALVREGVLSSVEARGGPEIALGDLLSYQESARERLLIAAGPIDEPSDCD